MIKVIGRSRSKCYVSPKWLVQSKHCEIWRKRDMFVLVFFDFLDIRILEFQ